MRSGVLLAGGLAAALTATVFAASRDFWQGGSELSGVRVVLAATAMPSGPPVQVRPECTLTLANQLRNADGSAQDRFGVRGGPIPAGFKPVRAVGCGLYGDGRSQTATRLELRDPAALDALVAAYRTTSELEYAGPETACAAYGDLDPMIALVDAQGTAIRPAPPRDSVCGHIVPAVTTLDLKDQWIVTDSVTIH